MEEHKDLPYMWRKELSKKIEDLLDGGAEVCVDGVIKFNNKYIRPENDPLPPGNKIEIPQLAFPKFDINIDEEEFKLEAHYKPVLFFPLPIGTLITTYGETKEDAEKKWWEITEKYDLIPEMDWEGFHKANKRPYPA